MKVKSIVILGVVLVLIVAIGLLAVNGTRIFNTKYLFKPVGEAISLGLDLRGGVYAVYLGDSGEPEFDTKMRVAAGIMRNRLDRAGFTEATVAPQATDRIRVEIPDVQDPSAIMEILGKPAHLTFVGPDGVEIMDGKHIVEAYAAYDAGHYVVAFAMDAEGTEMFRDATSRFLNQPISIVLDGVEQSAPTVNSVIPDGKGVIQGQGSLEWAQTFANLILSGALPLNLEVIEMSAISATLGVEAMNTSIIAGVLGTILVMLFMIIFYRLLGLVADLALCIYILIVLYALALIPGVQLTLPGIAGILLGIGMAVDANVIIFERFREELAGGRNLSAAVERGFKNALTAIIDSNITTLIAAFVLMYFGTGPIKGFAVTLAIGVIASMFSAVFVSKFLLKQVIRLVPHKLSLYTRERKIITSEKKVFTGHTPVFLGISGAIIVVALAMTIFGTSVNAGIDFTGGSLLRYNVGQEFEVSTVEAALAELGIDEAQIMKEGVGEVKTGLQVRTRDLGDQAAQVTASLEAELRKTYPDAAFDEISNVGGVAGADLIQNAINACLYAFAGILIYIAWRFNFFSGLATLIGILHDVLIMCAFMVFFRSAYQVNSPFIAAILTIIGYSINNTIVIFDRIREFMKQGRNKSLQKREIVENCVRNTLGRTMNTTLTTLFTLVSLYVLGVQSIREFTFPLLVGMLAGVYSSLFVSPQIWAFWMDRDSFGGIKKLFKRNKEKVPAKGVTAKTAAPKPKKA